MLLELLKISLSSVFKNKLRSFLTMLGIVIGIMVIILMQAAIEGFRGQIQQEIDKLGSNSFVISKTPPMMNGNDWKKYRHRKDILVAYVDKLKNSCPHIKDVIPIQTKWGELIKYKRNKTEENIKIHGASVGWDRLMGYEIDKGRYFTCHELSKSFNSIILGETAKIKLFGNDNPIGKTVSLKGYKFVVIGTFIKKGQKMGKDNDGLATIPSYFFQRIYGKNRNSELLISAKNQKDISKAQDEAIVTLRRLRSVKPGMDNDFAIITKDLLNKKLGSIIGMIYLAAFSIGGMSIIVGSIGIMNIMLVSVTERTKEIGIRRSIGASGHNILVQFLFEAVILSFCGGGIGIGMGSLIARVIEKFTGWETGVPLYVIVLAFTFSVLIGILAGLYPAYKASKLNPIDCLRYD